MRTLFATNILQTLSVIYRTGHEVITTECETFKKQCWFFVLLSVFCLQCFCLKAHTVVSRTPLTHLHCVFLPKMKYNISYCFVWLEKLKRIWYQDILLKIKWYQDILLIIKMHFKPKQNICRLHSIRTNNFRYIYLGLKTRIWNTDV